MTGGATGISLSTGAVVNSGSVTGAGLYGVAVTGVGAVTNNAASGIAGYKAGITLGAGGTVSNSGIIGASGTAGYPFSINTATHVLTPLSSGVELSQSGGVGNASTGTIASNSSASRWPAAAA